MGKQLDTEIIKGDPMQYYLLLQHLTENQVLKQLEALPESIIVEEDNQIYNTAGIELSLEAAGET
jgi:hypothetical protein